MNNPSEFIIVNKEPILCPICLGKLSKLGDESINYFLIICDYFSYYGKPIRTYGKLIGNVCEMVEKLEGHGFVVTTESSEELINIKPVGFFQNKRFCACKRDHIPCLY